jgi:hypothetical protein
VTYLVERLAELRRHLDHLRELRPRVESSESLRRDLSLHNDVLFSLQMGRLRLLRLHVQLAAAGAELFRHLGHAPLRLVA